MAEKATGNGKAKGAEKPPKKTPEEKKAAREAEKAQTAAARKHALDNLRKKLPECVTDIIKMYDKMEEVHGSHVLSISHKKDNAAEITGIPKGILSREIARIRRKQKEMAREAGMSDEEREDVERFRDAMDGTPFGKYAAGKLAEASVS